MLVFEVTLSALSGRSGAVVRARASDIVVGGCEFESCHCHLTGSNHAWSTNTALDNAGTGLIIMCPMIIMYSMCGCFCTTSTNKIHYYTRRNACTPTNNHNNVTITIINGIHGFGATPMGRGCGLSSGHSKKNVFNFRPHG